MKIIKYVLIPVIILLTTSCYNYLEVNEIAIVEGLSIDYIDNNYQVILEIVDIKSDNENSYLIESSSTSLNDAFENINKLSSKKISMSHLETIIISKEILKNHIDEISNYFINNKDITTNFYLVIANNPKDILNNSNNNYPINTKTITDILSKDNSNKYRFDYIYTLIKNNKEFEIPIVSIDNNNIKIDKDLLMYEK